MDEPSETIADALELLAERQAEAPAIHAPGWETLTYGHLGAQVRYVRERLKTWEIQAGDIVGAALPSRPEMAVAIATLPSSCTFAPLDPCPTIAELAGDVARMSERPGETALERILREVEALTDEEAALQLDGNGSAGNAG